MSQGIRGKIEVGLQVLTSCQGGNFYVSELVRLG